MINLIRRLIPHKIKNFLINQVDRNYRFKGWNLKTKNCPPWKYINKNEINNSQLSYFPDIQKEFENSIIDKKFISKQFELNMLEKSRELMWRHYNASLSIKFVLSRVKKKISLCEVGVADGITAWFVLSVLSKEKKDHNTLWLYDSWEEMKKEHLNKDEYNKIGKFKTNDLSITKKNLGLFKNTKFVKGFIPGTFKEKENSPKVCDWLHIDLNSSNATIETLDFFEPKLNINSLVLFDDFGWPSYETTRIAVEKWCSKRKGVLWPLPTGQALYFADKN